MATSVIKVISDSVCDVPPALVEKLDITLIPTVVNIDGHSFLDDGVQITRSEFFRRLPKMQNLPTTSACPLGLTRDLVAAQAARADHLVLISAPAHLSSIHNNFRVAAEEFAPGRYTLIDSGQVTMGQGFLVIAAAEAALARADPAAISAIIADMQPRISVFGALRTVENLRKSGRVSWATAMTSMILQIKPVVELTLGQVKSVANIRTFNRAMQRLAEIAQAQAPLERLAVLHTENFDGAYELRSMLSSLHPIDDMLVVNVNPSLGTHVGAGALGIALVSK